MDHQRAYSVLALLSFATKSSVGEGSRYAVLEGPDNAGREFVFTFADNQPQPSPQWYIHAYYKMTPVHCNVTYFLGKNATSFQILVEPYLSKNDTELIAERSIVISSADEVMVDRKCVHVACSDEVMIYANSNAQFSTDAFLVLPVDILSTNYFVASSPHTFQQLDVSSSIVVTAALCESTLVTFTFNSQGTQIRDPFSYNLVQVSGNYNVTLDRFQTIAILSSFDLTGTEINASCPVAVISGNKRGAIGEQMTADHLVEMIPPTNTWGRQFLTTPLFGRVSGDIFRLIAGTNATTCDILSSINSSDHNLRDLVLAERGQFLQLNVSSEEYLNITCSSTILLVQYSKSADLGSSYGDPFMMITPSVVHFNNRYTVSTVRPRQGDYDHYISIIIRLSEVGGLVFDAELVTNMYTQDEPIHRDLMRNVTIHHELMRNITIHGTDFQNLVFKVTHGVHWLSHENPTVSFGLMVYGHKRSESYGYPGGLRLPHSGVYCKTSKPKINDNIDNDCDFVVDEELSDGIDNDLDGKIDEDVAANDAFPVFEPLYEAHVLRSEEYESPITTTTLWATLSFLLAATLLSPLSAIFIWLRHRQTRRAAAGLAVLELRNTPQRISIRLVWKGFGRYKFMSEDLTSSATLESQ